MPNHSSIASGATSTRPPTTKRAVGVDEKYLADAKVDDHLPGSGYYPHNIHFVMASAQMAGDGPTVIAAAEKLRALIPDEVSKGHRDGASGQGRPLSSLSAAVQGAPKTILALA